MATDRAMERDGAADDRSRSVSSGHPWTERDDPVLCMVSVQASDEIRPKKRDVAGSPDNHVDPDNATSIDPR